MQLALFIILAILSTLTPTAFAVEPAPPEAAVRVIRDNGGQGIIAVIINCSPSPESESKKLEKVLETRSDIGTLVVAEGAGPEEVIKVFTDLTAEVGEVPADLAFVSLECPGIGGDQNMEQLGTKAGPLSFAELQKAMKPLAKSFFVLLDSSRNSFGPTANDIPESGILPDAMAISTGIESFTAPGGLIVAAAETIEKSQGGMITLGSFYKDGVKVAARHLDLGISRSGDEDRWYQNWGRLFLPGGALILPPAPPPTTPPSAVGKNWKLPSKTPASALIGAGGIGLGVGGIFAVRAVEPHRVLARCATEGCSQKELGAATSSFKKNRNLAIGLGSAGIGLVGGGTWWLLAGSHQKTSVAFSGDSVTVTGSF